MLVGGKLGKYELVKLIGAGGMGEVFLAKDAQLGREVALKVLLPEFCLDENRVKRFMYEARAVSTLNHPGIITIHEIVEDGDDLFIATEFVDGETVREKIEQKTLDLYQAVSIAEQVADALSVAHEAKIAHRDIKPENIMVRKDGIAKVLDFGLAKPLVAAGDKSDDEHLLVKTQPGLVIGSVRYMSPEQARGKDTDGRTDVWSLGVVLYEMITGNTPFDGETISDQLAALIHAEPKPLVEIPAQLDEIVRRCLRKVADERYPSMKELGADLRKLRLDLERRAEDTASSDFINTIALPKQNTSENATLIHQTISSDKTSGLIPNGQQSTVETVRSNSGRLSLAAAAVFVVVMGLAGWFSIPAWFGGGSPTYETIQVSRVTDDGNSRNAAVSPDGKFVAFASVSDSGSTLFVRQVATGTEVEIVPESEEMYMQPVFSPDGDFIYFVGVLNGVGTLRRVSALGGETTVLVNDVDSRPAVSPDGGRIAFFRHDPTRGGDKLLIVDNQGKKEEILAETTGLGLDKLTDVFWNAAGTRVMAAGLRLSGEPVSHTRLMAIDAVSKKVVDDPSVGILAQSEWAPATAFQPLSDGSGIIFVGRRTEDEVLQIWHLNLRSEQVSPITTDTSDYECVSVSSDGKTIIATKSEWTGGMISYDPVTKDQKQIKPESNRVFGRNGISVTADDQILFSARDSQEINLYVIDPVTGNERRLTNASRYNIHPVSTRKEGAVVFASNRGRSFGIWKMDKDGGNPVQLTDPENGADVTPVLVNDDKTIFFVRKVNDGGLSKLMKVSIDGGEATELLPGSKSSNMHPRVSPDGKMFAYIAVDFNQEVAELSSEIRFASIEGSSIASTKVFDDTLSTSYDKWFTWSPSGNGVTRKKADAGSQLWDTPLKGGKEKQLTAMTSGMIGSFVWSREGSKLYIVKGDGRSDLVLIRSGAGE